MMRPLLSRAFALAALALASCGLTTPPPPQGLVAPAASEASAGAEADKVAFQLPADGRLAALKVSVINPPPDLFDERGAGLITLKRKGRQEAGRLIFLNDTLSVFSLLPGIYRMEAIAGYDCGEIFLVLPKRPGPLALGQLELEATGPEEARLSGRVPAPQDLDAVAALIDADPAAIESQPLERRQAVICKRARWAASRPDIDPTARVFTPLEIAEGVVLFALVGAASGAAIASGSFVFATGTGGGFIAAGF